MKRVKYFIVTIVTFIALFTNAFFVNAQDIITLRNGDEIRAKVTEITLTEVRYRLFENLEGPVRIVTKNDVFFITYENGTREVITTAEAADTNRNTNRTDPVTLPVSQGDIAIGINTLYGTYSNDVVTIGIGFKFFYNASDAIRLAGELDFSIGSSGIITWGIQDYSIYGHYLFPLGKRFLVYPLLGLGYLNATGETLSLWGVPSFSTSESGAVFALGGGVNWALTSNLLYTSELRIKRHSGNTHVVFTLGLAYKF